MTSMENNGMTLFGGGTIDFEGFRPPVEDDESDEEAVKQREEELRNDLENAFDDLIEDESFQESSSIYSGSRHRSLHRQNTPEHCENFEGGSVSEKRSDPELKSNKVTFSDEHPMTPVWSDASDNSGNFVHEASIVSSPTHFHLNMNSIISQSDNSEPLTEGVRGNRYQGCSEKCSKGRKDYGSNSSYKEDGINNMDFLSAETSYDQLKLLYEARGRELDKISEQLENLKKMSNEEISSLKQQLIIVKAEKDGLYTNNNHLKLLLSENEGRIRSLSGDIREKDKLCNKLEGENKELELKVKVAEGTIMNLERHVAELQSLDSISKSHQAHEDFLKKLKNSHDEQTNELRRKLKTLSNKVEELEQERKNFKDELSTVRRSKEMALQEKSEIIYQLTSKLEASQQQMKILLSKKGSDILELETPSNFEVNELKRKINLLESQLKQAKSDLESYERLLKLGLFKSSTENGIDDTLDQLNLAKVLNFDESNSNPRYPSTKGKNQMPQQFNINENMKKELLQVLFKNKKYKEEINSLNDIISEKQKQCRILESELKSSLVKTSIDTDSNVSQQYKLLEENLALKRRLEVFVENVEKLRKESKMVCQNLRDFKLNPAKDNVKDLEDISEIIKNFVDVVSQFNSENQMSELRGYSVRYVIDGKFDAIIKCLRDFKDNLLEKHNPNSSDVSTLKRLIDGFYTKAEEFKKEIQYFENGKTQSDISAQKLDFEKTKNENAALAFKIQILENRVKSFDEEKRELLENCKDNYLKFHEETVTQLKNALQSEYNVIVNSLKDELKRLSNELSETREKYVEMCREKNGVMERKNCSDEELKILKDTLIKENDDLKKEIGELKSVCHEKEEKYLREIIGLKSQISSLKASSEEGNVSISQNIELMEYKEKVVRLSNEIERITNEYERFRAQIEKEGNGNQKDGSDLSLSQMIDTIKKYKEFNDDLKEEKSKLKIYYETQINDFRKKIEACDKDSEDLLTRNRIESENKFKEEVEQLREKVNNLSDLVNHLEEEKCKLEAGHAETMNKVTEDIRKQEQYIKDMKLTWDIQLQNLTKSMHEMNVEKSRYQRDATYVIEKHKLLGEKYSKLKSKYFRIQNHFENLRMWTEERERKIVEEAERITKMKVEVNESQFKHFKEYLNDSKTVLADTVSKVIENLKLVPERALPSSTLEPHIVALTKVHEAILKLDVRRKDV